MYCVSVYKTPKFFPRYATTYSFHRHILAAVHFNYNLQRDVRRRNADDAEQIKVTYPKFKNGEAIVRNIRVSQNFGK